MPPTSESPPTRTDASPDRAPRRGRDRAGSCSLAWDDAPEPTWGSAAHATFWVAMEQTGPWGRDAFAQSRLDPDFGRTLEERCFRAGGRALLIRVVGPERDSGTGENGRPRRVFVASGMPARPWLLAGHVADPRLVADLDLEAVVAGDAEAVIASSPWLRHHDAPVALVCTNSKRDVCCAVRGRPVAVEAANRRPGQVWECSHTGGHRFAPTGVLLPHGVTFARCGADTVVAALDAACEERLPPALIDPRHLRGLSYLWPAEQAADAAVRARAGVLDLTGLSLDLLDGPSVVPAEGGHAGDGSQAVRRFAVRHVDGRTWQVTVSARSSKEERVSSCGTSPVPVQSFVAHVT